MSQVWKKAIGLGIESVFATEVLPTIHLCSFGSSTLNTKPTYIQVSGTKQSRGKIDSVIGAAVVGGDLSDWEVRPDELDAVLEAAMGTKTGGPAPAAIVFTLKDGVLPSMTVEETKADAFGMIHSGVKINEMAFSVGINTILVANIGMVGRLTRTVALGALAAPTYTTKRPWIMHRGVLKRGAVEIKVFSWEMTLNNNLKAPNFTSGSLYSENHSEGVREVTGSFTMDTADKTQLDEVLGSTEATLEFTFTNGTQTLLWEFPKVIFEELDFDEEDQDLVQNINFTAYRVHSTDTNEFKITITG